MKCDLIKREDFEMDALQAFDFFKGIKSKSKVEGFDLDANRASISLWSQAASSYESSLSKLTNEWFNSVGKTVTRELGAALAPKLKDFEKLMSSAYTKAYQAGALKMGNSKYKDSKNFSPSDKRFLKQKVSKEMRYLKRYLSQDGAKKLAGKNFRGVSRAQGFSKSLDSSFFEGMLAGADDAQVFFWELQGAVAMHCPDCISLNVDSPYLKKNLPTVPRAGMTQCHSYCQCVLRAEGLPADAELSSPFSGSGLPMDAECGAYTADGQAVAGGVQDLFDKLYKQLNLSRGKIFSTTGAEQKQWISQRAAINKDIIDLSQSYKVRVTPKWSVKDIQANVNTLMKKGLTHITDIRSLAADSTVYLVNGGAMQVATIDIKDGVLGFNISGRWAKIDSADDFLIFSSGGE